MNDYKAPRDPKPLWKEYVEQETARSMNAFYEIFGTKEDQMSNNPVQTILRFVEESRDELLKFEKFWLDMAARSPDAFPLSMAAGEWHEQFIAWLDSAP